MRIIHLLPGLMTGGLETMVINIANSQAELHNVMVMIINDDYDLDLLNGFNKNVEVCLLNRPRSSKNPFYLFKMNMMILKWKPYVVHLHYEELIKYLMPLRYKIVYTIHDTTINASDLNRNRNSVAISKCVQEDVIKRTSLRPIVIYNGINVERITCKKNVIGYHKDRPFKIVQVSRLAHQKKGQHILLQAVAKLQSKGYTNITLDFIGEGNSRTYLEQLVKDCDIKNVEFLGNQTVSYINRNLSDYDLFVQPSLFEGFGLTVAEAMAAKVPVIVSENEGPLEIVNNGIYGLTFKNGSIEECAEKIEVLINTPIEILQQRVDAAWDFVYNNFNVRATADNYIKYYTQCE